MAVSTVGAADEVVGAGAEAEAAAIAEDVEADAAGIAMGAARAVSGSLQVEK